MLKNAIRITDNNDAVMVYFDVKETRMEGKRTFELHWMMPGATPESVTCGIVGKVFRNSLTAHVWARREAVVWQSENCGRINGYAPTFDIWSDKWDY